MANGLGAPAAGIVQPRVSDLIRVPDVEPLATPNLVDAFHKGFVTADDIISRIDNRARLKKKAEEQLYREQLSPEATEARAAVEAAKAAEAKARSQKADLDAEEMPYVKRIRRLEAARKIAEGESFGSIDTISKQFTLLGIPMPLRQDPETGLTIPDLPRAHEEYAGVQGYLQFMQTAKGRIDQLKDQEVQIGKAKGMGVIDPTGRLNMAEARKVRNKLYELTSLTYGQWKALGQPKDASLFAGQQVVSPAVPQQVTPAAQSVPAPVPAPAPAPVPQAMVPATPEVGQMSPEGVMMTTVPSEGGEPGTEVQVRAKAALGRFQQSGQMQQALAEQGFDPASIGTWFNAMLPEILKSGDVKMWEAAKSAWSQGVLRMESGAAISQREQKWYEDSFFPQVNDPPAVQQAKERLRLDMERVVSEVANAGGAGSPATVRAAQDVVARAERVSGWSGTKGTRNPASLGFQKVYRADGSVLWKDPNSGQYFEANTSAAPAPTPTPAPSATPAVPMAPTVEPRRPSGYVPRPTPEPSPNPWLETAADVIWPFRAAERKQKQ